MIWALVQRFKLGILAGGVVVALLIALIDARMDLAAERERCNVDKLQAILESERATWAAKEQGYQRRAAALMELNERGDEAVENAQLVAEIANEERVGLEAEIRRLMLQGETDEIPDSFECLNVFIPERGLDRLRQPAADCRESGTRGDPGADDVCADPRLAAGAAPAGSNLSAITYGEGLALWAYDRASIRSLNAQLEAIEQLGDEIPPAE